MFDAGKNYKALKSASKVTVTKSGDTYTVTKKRYDAETGAELSDYIVNTEASEITRKIEACTDMITNTTAEKEDWEELKEDTEAL